MNEVLTAISTVGFPIIMCLLQWHQSNTTLKEVTTALSNNTAAMTSLTDRLDSKVDN